MTFIVIIFNGKKFNPMSGVNLYDYGARFYDPAIGRFTTQDPLAEKYGPTSPYVYCLNDPVNKFDPDGEKVVFVNGYLGFGSPEGGAAYWNGEKSLFVRSA